MEYLGGEKRKRHERESDIRFAPQVKRLDRGDRRNRVPWQATSQAKNNQIQEDERHREFLAQESQFVLAQKRKASEIRVAEGRARPIDRLAVNLRRIDPIEDLINDDTLASDLEYIDPETTIEQLPLSELIEVRRGIKDFLQLGGRHESREYWRALEIVCRDRQRRLEATINGTATQGVSSDITKVLAPKSFAELEKLERQINIKLNSDEAMDEDYWQQLLDNLLVYKAKARLSGLRQRILEQNLSSSRIPNRIEALQTNEALSENLVPILIHAQGLGPGSSVERKVDRPGISSTQEDELLDGTTKQEQKVFQGQHITGTRDQRTKSFCAQSEDRSTTKDLLIYDREVAKGVNEDEVIFAGEEEVETHGRSHSKMAAHFRKPRYFNRVQLGYEWNKYNQTHYDHENPPPKVVQGYKFHIFYPELVDKTKAPTYKIIREGGRKKGQTLAPAGEEDTCIIQFMAGSPYKDVAFRIVDRDWDYSARQDRGFKSTFEDGILTLHFSFKKVYYRK